MNMHEKILDNLQELVYIADMETYELLYYNRALAEEFHIPQGLQGKCYEILQGRRDPCPFCTNGRLSQDGCYVWKFYNKLVGRHFLLSDSICEFNGRQVRTEIASDITEHVLLQEQLDKNLSLQNFINRCARKLYRQDADLPFLIDDVLAAIGEYCRRTEPTSSNFPTMSSAIPLNGAERASCPKRNFWPMSLWASLPAGCPIFTPTNPS